MALDIPPANPPTGLIDRILNGAFNMCPEGTQTSADGSTRFVNYTVLTQSNDIQTSQLTAPESGQSRAARLTQANATAQRFGLCQTIANINCQDLRESTLSAAHRARLSASGRTMFALLEWTGTADTSSADPINDWTSDQYIPGQFFKSTFTVLNYGYLSADMAEWASAPFIPFQAGASLNNLVYVVWTEDAQAQNVTLDLGLWQVIAGVHPLAFEHRPYALELAIANSGSTPITLASIAALQAQTWTAANAPSVVVLSTNYYTNDGGGEFSYLSASVASDNGGTLIVTTSGLRYGRRYAGPLMAQWFGVNPANSNNFAALNRAIAAASGLTLMLPSGTISATLPAGTGFTAPGAGTTIQGLGRDSTALAATCATGAFLTAFDCSAGSITFRSLKATLTLQAAGTAALTLVGDDLTFDDCELVSNGSATIDAIVCNFPTGATTQDGLFFFNCIVHGWLGPFNKTNAATSTQRRTRIIGGYWYDNTAHHFSANSPAGVWDDIIIDGVRFGNQSGLTGGQGHWIAFARATNFVVVNCTGSGNTDGEAIHIEDLCDGFVIADNIFTVSSTQATYGKGIIVENGGAGNDAPTNGKIHDNDITHSGSTTTTGIELLDTTGTHPLTNIECNDNTVTGFSVGITVATDMLAIGLRDNLCQDCTTGLTAEVLAPSLTSLKVDGCTTGVTAQRGMMGHLEIRGALTALATSSAGVVTITSWAKSLNAQTLAATTDTNFTLAPIGERVYGTVSVQLQQSGTQYMAAQRLFSWDGAAETDTAQIKTTAGDIDLTALDESGGNFRMIVFNAGAQKTNCNLRVSFQGSYIV